MRIILAKRYTKYVVLGIGMLLFFFFGRHFDYTLNDIDLMTKMNQKDIENAQGGVYSLVPSAKPITVTLSNSLKTGDTIRMFYNIESDNGILEQPYESSPMDLAVYVVSDFNEEQLIDNLTIQVPGDVRFREVVFTSELNATRLLIRRNDLRTTGGLVISNVKTFRLNVAAENLDNLKPTIASVSDLTKEVFSTGENFDGSFPMVFTRKDQLFGQPFTVNADKKISSVDLALSWRGSGGGGNYLLELTKMSDEKKDFPKIVARYLFSREAVKDRFVENNIYRLPLTAELEKGVDYMISINNNSVQFNLFNTLAVDGFDSKGIVLPALTKKGSDKLRPIAESLYLKINSAECRKIDNECIPDGSIVQDLGNGVGFYSHESSGSSLDFFDLYKFDSGTFYDNSAGGVIAPTTKDTSFYYKFDTIYPYKIIKIILNQDVRNTSKNSLFYSFDNKNWTLIDQNKDGAPVIEKVIEIESTNQTELFIKVTYDHADAKYKGSGYFGIKGINVTASLSVK